MVIAFEDNEKSSISQLLKRAYSLDEKVLLSFSKGNKRMSEYIATISSNKPVIVYVDVVPDKYETVESYNKCVKVIAENELKGIYIIPIPCIEYYVIKAFLNRSNPEVKCVMEGLNYKLVDENDKGYRLSTKDFENYCKSVVNNYRGCFRNDGDFYVRDCLCNKGKYIDGCEENLLDDKACKLVSTLPAFYSMSLSSKIDTHIVNIEDVINKCRQGYYELANKYVEYGIIRNVYKLKGQMLQPVDFVNVD